MHARKIDTVEGMNYTTVKPTIKPVPSTKGTSLWRSWLWTKTGSILSYRKLQILVHKTEPYLFGLMLCSLTKQILHETELLMSVIISSRKDEIPSPYSPASVSYTHLDVYKRQISCSLKKYCTLMSFNTKIDGYFVILNFKITGTLIIWLLKAL